MYPPLLTWAQQSSYTAATAEIATTVTVTDNESTAECNAVTFVADADLDGGNVGLESDGDICYNPSTGTLAATAFSGVGTALTALNGENIQDDTIDDDSIDLSTGAGLSAADMPDEDVGDVTWSSGAVLLDSTQTGTRAARDAYFTAPAAGDLWQVDDGDAADPCGTGGGAVVTLCQYDGNSWVDVQAGSGAASTLDEAFDGGPDIDNATEANPLTLSDGSCTPMEFYCDAGGDAFVGIVPSTDTTTYVQANFDWVGYDAEDDSNFVLCDMDAGGVGVGTCTWRSADTHTFGTISGRKDTTAGTSDTVTLTECGDVRVFNTDSADALTVNLCAGTVGDEVCVANTDGATEVITVDANGSEVIHLNDGTDITALAGGTAVVSGGAETDAACFTYTGNFWFMWNPVGTWASE